MKVEAATDTVEVYGKQDRGRPRGRNGEADGVLDATSGILDVQQALCEHEKIVHQSDNL